MANDTDSSEAMSDKGPAKPAKPTGGLRSEMGANAVLLVTLILLLAVLPLVSGDATERFVNRVIWSVAIVAGIYKASGRRIFLWAALIISVPSLLSHWFDFFSFVPAGPALVALFFSLIAAQILADIFSKDRVEVDQILGGVNVYLLLGIVFARLHVAVEGFAAGSYTLDGLPIAAAVAQSGQHLDEVLQYFSFITLTTLGYGDILPVSEAARTLSTVEAVVGQLFVAVLIARLISAHAANAGRG